MNFLHNVFLNFNLCAGNPTPPIVTTSDNTEDDVVLAVLLVVTTFVVLIIIALALGAYVRSKSNKTNPLNPTEQQAQNSSTENKVQTQNNQASAQASQQPPTPQATAKSSHGFLIFLIKLLLLGAIVFFTLWNYRLFEINKGWSKTEINNKSSFTQVIELIVDIEEVEYFKVPHSCDSDNYKVHISTSTKSYLFNATENDIKVLKAVGVLSSKLKAESVTVIPFYVELVLGLLVIFIPFRKRK